MCPNTKAFFGTTTPKDCAACNAFMTDLSLIAQYDPSHFKVIYSHVTPVRFDLWFWNFLKFYLSKSLAPSVLKSVPNWVVSKQKSVSEKSKTLKKMFVTLSLVLTLNKSVKPLCSVNKFIHSDCYWLQLIAEFGHLLWIYNFVFRNKIKFGIKYGMTVHSPRVLPVLFVRIFLEIFWCWKLRLKTDSFGSLDHCVILNEYILDRNKMKQKWNLHWNYVQ